MNIQTAKLKEKQGELKPIKLIDAHHHLWDLNLHKYPWLQDYDPNTFMGDYRSIMRNYSPDDYKHDSEGFEILATVHCEADHDYEDEVAETKWLYQQFEQFGFPNAIIGHVWFHLDSCEDILAAHCAYPNFKGIRSKPITAKSFDEKSSVYGLAGSMQDENWLKGFSLLEKYGLSWDLRVPYWHLPDAAQVAKAFPQTPIVLNHAGFPWDRTEQGLERWRTGMQALAECKNAFVKISELSTPGQKWDLESNRQIVHEIIDLFGIERCMFASNFPVAGLAISYHDLVYNLNDILKNMTEYERECFFWRTANKFYCLGSLRSIPILNRGLTPEFI